MGIKDRIFFLILASTAVNFASPAFSQENSAISLSKSAETAGLEAYAAGDWSGASILLRKAVASGSSSDGMRYMLIMSLMNSEIMTRLFLIARLFLQTIPKAYCVLM